MRPSSKNAPCRYANDRMESDATHRAAHGNQQEIPKRGNTSAYYFVACVVRMSDRKIRRPTCILRSDPCARARNLPPCAVASIAPCARLSCPPHGTQRPAGKRAHRPPTDTSIMRMCFEGSSIIRMCFVFQLGCRSRHRTQANSCDGVVRCIPGY